MVSLVSLFPSLSGKAPTDRGHTHCCWETSEMLRAFKVETPEERSLYSNHVTAVPVSLEIEKYHTGL